MGWQPANAGLRGVAGLRPDSAPHVRLGPWPVAPRPLSPKLLVPMAWFQSPGCLPLLLNNYVCGTSLAACSPSALGWPSSCAASRARCLPLPRWWPMDAQRLRCLACSSNLRQSNGAGLRVGCAAQPSLYMLPCPGNANACPPRGPRLQSRILPRSKKCLPVLTRMFSSMSVFSAEVASDELPAKVYLTM